MKRSIMTQYDCCEARAYLLSNGGQYCDIYTKS